MKCFVMKTNEPYLLDFIIMLQEKGKDVHVIESIPTHELISNLIQWRTGILFAGTELLVGKGKEIAEEIQSSLPNIHIVYVTESERYAINAFEVGASDYLLLPVKEKRLEQTFGKISKEIGLIEDKYYISSFGDIAFSLPNEKEDIVLKWRTKKAKELFAYLLQQRGKLVRKDYLVDLLWPNTNWQQGISLLYSTAYQVRKLIQSINFPVVIENSENHYQLLMNDVKCRVKEWERAVNRLDEINQYNVDKYLQTIHEYTADYLSKMNYHWAEMERKRLHDKWLGIVRTATDYYWSQGNYFDVAKVSYYVQNISPINEASYINLMKVYEALEEHASLKMVYHTYEKMLAEELSIEVPQAIQEKYKQIIDI